MFYYDFFYEGHFDEKWGNLLIASKFNAQSSHPFQGTWLGKQKLSQQLVADNATVRFL